MIFLPFRKPARDLEDIDNALWDVERDGDYNPDDDDDDDDDDLSTASGGMFVVPRGHL